MLQWFVDRPVISKQGFRKRFYAFYEANNAKQGLDAKFKIIWSNWDLAQAIYFYLSKTSL